jgi:hypothetical protein
MTQAINPLQQQGNYLYQKNQAAASNGQYQNIQGPNDVYNKTAAVALNTVKTLDKGLVNALKVSVAGLNNNAKQNAAKAADNAANGANNNQYNNQAQVPNAADTIGNFINKII